LLILLGISKFFVLILSGISKYFLNLLCFSPFAGLALQIDSSKQVFLFQLAGISSFILRVPLT